VAAGTAGVAGLLFLLNIYLLLVSLIAAGYPPLKG
jgi:uncharacterized membrane protein YtjA (UPF0391 family)